MHCSCFRGWLVQYNEKDIKAIYNDYKELESEPYAYSFLGNTNQHRSLLTLMKFVNHEFDIEYCQTCKKYYYKVTISSDELFNP